MNNEIINATSTEGIVKVQATKDLANLGFDRDFIGELTSRTAMFCSMDPKDDKEKAQLFNAMNNPAKRLADEINMTVMAKDLYCEVVTVNNVDESTGEVTARQLPRIVIIDDKGEGHQCVSIGVYSAMRKLIAMFGQPTWEKPLAIKVKQISKGTRNMLTLEI